MSGSAKLKKLLTKFPLFKDFSSNEFESLLPYCRTIELKADELLFEPGQASYSIYILEKGEIDIAKDRDDRNQAAKYIHGELINTMDIFSSNVHQYYGISQKDSRVLVFPASKDKELAFKMEHPSIKAKIMMGLMETISTRIRETNNRVQERNPMVEQLQEQLYRDSLTGVKNDLYLKDYLEQLDDTKFPMALYISKPDNFKELNDRLGHEAGDRAIQIMARSMDHRDDELGFVARFKGNAMAFVYLNCNRSEAKAHAKYIQSAQESIEYHPATDAPRLKFSVGYTYFTVKDRYHREEINYTHQLPIDSRLEGGHKITHREPKCHE